MSKPGDNKGVSNVKNKLSEEDVIFIFRNTTMTQHALANKFAVSQGTVNHIKRGRTWAWLTKDL